MPGSCSREPDKGVKENQDGADAGDRVPSTSFGKQEKSADPDDVAVLKVNGQ